MAKYRIEIPEQFELQPAINVTATKFNPREVPAVKNVLLSENLISLTASGRIRLGKETRRD